MMDVKWVSMGRSVCSAALLTLAGCGGGGSASSSPGGSAETGVPVQNSIVPSAAPRAFGAAPAMGSCEMFPAAAVFNTRIDDAARFPAHASSAGWVSSIGAGAHFHADWGVNDNPAQPSTYWGMPVNTVDGTAATTQWPLLAFAFSPSGVSMQSGYPHESDCAVPSGDGFAISRNCSAVAPAARHFPFPLDANLRNENGQCGGPGSCGDHHVLVVEQGACRLWESYSAFKLSNQWYAMSTAAWDLKSLSLRPSGWTSADAAGLPITPLLAKAAEASSGEVRHALRMTLRDSVLANSFDWPARHAAGDPTPGGIPFGSVLRLKADFVIPPEWTPQARALATAMKRYGAYVADIGEDLYVQGEPSAAWDPRTFTQLNTLPLAQMEFVGMNAVTTDPRFSRDSMAARW